MGENAPNGTLLFNELRLLQQLCDAVIRVGDSEFPVHKLILCNCSSYFKALFTNWSTPDSRFFDIPNVSADMMGLIIEFAYTGCINVPEANIRELFVAADQFDVKGIVQACSDYLEKQLSPQNCIGICMFADAYYTPELRQKAFTCLLSRFEEVAATSEEFLQLSAQEVTSLLENDHLNVRKEERVLEAIIHWISFSPEERRSYISLLLTSVRLALMNPLNILESVVKNELVRASEESLPILLKGLDATLDKGLRRFSDSPLARPRLPPAFIMAVGGWSGGGTIGRIAAYDVRADWWVTVGDDEEYPLAYHGTAFLNGSLYCIGGFDGVIQFNTVHKYDLSTHTWQEVAPMHMRRCYVSVTVLDGQIYAMGGCNGDDRLETAERYDPSANQWTLIASMHDHRSDASSTTLDGKVYICGGFNGSECLSSAEYYNPATDQWTLIAPMGSSRSGVGVIAYGGHIFAVGGFNGTSRLHTAEAYNPRTNTWHAVPPMLNPRSNFGIEVIEDHIFVIGGFNGFTTTCDVESFDFETSEWSDACDMGISCSALSCCVVFGLPNMAEFAAPRHSFPVSEEIVEVE